MLRVMHIFAATFSMYVITHLFVFLYFPVAILVSYIDQERIPDLKRFFVRGLFAIVGKRLTISGLDNLEPGHAYLIISNYPSFYAGFALTGAFPRASIVAHAFTRKVPLLGQVLRRLGAIFVQPGRGGQGIRSLDQELKRQQVMPSLIILPEGARTKDGEIKPFKRGFIRILRQTSLDLLPVTQNGLYQLKPMKRFYLDSEAEPEMVIHKPIPNAVARRMTDNELRAMAHCVIAGAYRP